MTKISIILCTARDDYAMKGLPSTHIFDLTLESLKQQTFKDFELIIVDALKNKRKYFLDKSFPFLIKHITPKPSIWDKLGCWRVCTQFNTGLVHANGELIVRIDDCSSFNPDYLDRCWYWYKRGYFPQALVVYHHGTKPMIYDEKAKQLYVETLTSEGETYDEIMKKLDMLYKPGEIIKDSRWQFLEGKSELYGNMKDWWYGYGAAPLEAFLKINGYDERFDGKKSLEEVDAGSRLEMAGYSNLVLDKRLTVVEHFHGSPSKKVISYKGKPACCNYAILLLNRNKNRFRTNSDILTKKDLKFIWEETCRSPCSHKGGKDYDYEMFKIWAHNQPLFDLRVERERLKNIS